jgi:hypothetical protein
MERMNLTDPWTGQGASDRQLSGKTLRAGL